jgi:hypothetical protein
MNVAVMDLNLLFNAITQFLNSLVGTPLGNTGVTIYAAEFQE